MHLFLKKSNITFKLSLRGRMGERLMHLLVYWDSRARKILSCTGAWFNSSAPLLLHAHTSVEKAPVKMHRIAAKLSFFTIYLKCSESVTFLVTTLSSNGRIINIISVDHILWESNSSVQEKLPDFSIWAILWYVVDLFLVVSITGL